MKKKNVVKAAIICTGAAALGYIVKKVYDIIKDLKNLRFDDLNDDLFDCDLEKTQNEKNIFAAHPISSDAPSNDDNFEVEASDEDFVNEDEITEETEIIVDQSEDDADIVLPPEVINKVGKLEDLLTFEGLDFDTNQRDYLYHIIDYMKRNHEMRMALLIGMDYNGHNPIEVFTDNQFAEIKKIIG